MPHKLQNTIYLYCLNNFNIFIIYLELSVAISLKKFHNSSGNPVFLHPQIVCESNSVIGVPVMVHLGGKTKFARILGSRPWGRGRTP